MALSNLPPLPPNATIELCTEQNLQAFRRMNALLLPIPYQDSFYKETLNDPVVSSITRIALWHDISTVKHNTLPASFITGNVNPPRVVAAIRCRLLLSVPGASDDNGPILYISTLTTLAPFRRHALAGHLLSTVAQTAVEQYGIRAIVAHVWEANEDGLEWYSKRGFRVVDRDEMYYRRLAPRTAALLIRRDIIPGDVLGWKDQSAFEERTGAG